MQVPSTTRRQWWHRSRSGVFVVRFSATAFWNTGVSVMRRRTTRPTTISRQESRKGMRQPQASISSCGSAMPKSRLIPYAQKKPMGAPRLGKLPNSARFSAGAFSVATSAAPDHSPASPRPWQARHTHRSTTERGPSASYPGRRPTQNVAMPISSKAATRVFFRPKRSPKWPNRRLPKGRARKLTEKVTKARSVASTGSLLATSVKKMKPK